MSKRSNELTAHSYSHLYQIRTTAKRGAYRQNVMTHRLPPRHRRARRIQARTHWNVPPIRAFVTWYREFYGV